MAEPIRTDAAVLTDEEARATVAMLAPYLPASLVPVFDARFARSTSLYEEFVHRVVLGVVQAAGLEAPARAGGTARAIVERAGLEPGRALVPVEWMLRHLAARGHFDTEQDQRGATVFRLRGALARPDPRPLAEAQAEHDASALPSYALVETVARDYPAFLAGRVTGEAVLFTPGRFRLWADYFSNENVIYAVNNRVAALALAEWLPRPAPVIVELGGGLGSGALAALDVLADAGRLDEIREYRFTELVPAFLRRGQAVIGTRWPQAAFLSAAPLDINRPFVEQGVGEESVSAVYAVNTLHVAHDLGETLAEMRRALRPGGRLVIGECVRPLPGQTIYAEFVFNLMEAFRAPRLHPEWRPNGGFLTPEQWARALESAGFVDVAFIPDVRRLRERFPLFYVGAIGATRAA